MNVSRHGDGDSEIKRHKAGEVIGLVVLLACAGLLAYGIYDN